MLCTGKHEVAFVKALQGGMQHTDGSLNIAGGVGVGGLFERQSHGSPTNQKFCG